MIPRGSHRHPITLHILGYPIVSYRLCKRLSAIYLAGKVFDAEFCNMADDEMYLENLQEFVVQEERIVSLRIP